MMKTPSPLISAFSWPTQLGVAATSVVLASCATFPSENNKSNIINRVHSRKLYHNFQQFPHCMVSSPPFCSACTADAAPQLSMVFVSTAVVV